MRINPGQLYEVLAHPNVIVLSVGAIVIPRAPVSEKELKLFREGLDSRTVLKVIDTEEWRVCLRDEAEICVVPASCLKPLPPVDIAKSDRVVVDVPAE